MRGKFAIQTEELLLLLSQLLYNGRAPSSALSLCSAAQGDCGMLSKGAGNHDIQGAAVEWKCRNVR